MKIDSPSERIELGSIFLDSLTLDAAVNQISCLSRKNTFSYVVTPNVDHLARIIEKDAGGELLNIYKHAALSLCDSRIIDRLLWLKGGDRVKEVIPGSTLTEYLFRKILRPEDRILIVGIDAYYIERLRTSYPSLDIAHINPSMGFIDKPSEVKDIVERVESARANYIFLSVGSPRQEFLAGILGASSATGVGLCVGASILFLTGVEKRAPILVQKLHMEWAFRMLHDPKRLITRYFGNFLSLLAIYKIL